MREHRNQKNFLSSRKQYFYFIIGLLILIFISFPIFKKIKKQNGLTREVDGLKKEIEQMEMKNDELHKMISYLESEEFVELEARKKLNYKKEGEEVLVIKDESGLGGELIDRKPGKMEATKVRSWFKYFFE